MDELLKLLDYVTEDKKDAAKEIVEKIKEKAEKNEKLIRELEAKKIEAIQTRDKTKTKLKSIAKNLGAEDVDNIEDAIEAILSTKKTGAKEDKELERLKAEIAKREEEINNLASSLDSVKTEAENKIKKVLFERDFIKIANKYKVKEPLQNLLAKDIFDKVAIEGDKIKLLNEDGTTMRIDNEDATLEKYIESLKKEEENKKEFVFFNNEVQPSGAKTTAGSKLVNRFVPGAEDY